MNEQEEEKVVVEAFNAGYILQKYKPDILERVLSDANRESTFISFMADGQRQQKKEVLLKQQKELRQKKKENKPSRNH